MCVLCVLSVAHEALQLPMAFLSSFSHFCMSISCLSGLSHTRINVFLSRRHLETTTHVRKQPQHAWQKVSRALKRRWRRGLADTHKWNFVRGPSFMISDSSQCSSMGFLCLGVWHRLILNQREHELWQQCWLNVDITVVLSRRLALTFLGRCRKFSAAFLPGGVGSGYYLYSLVACWA